MVTSTFTQLPSSVRFLVSSEGLLWSMHRVKLLSQIIIIIIWTPMNFDCFFLVLISLLNFNVQYQLYPELYISELIIDILNQLGKKNT